MKRPDQQAILGLLVVAAILSVGGLVLVGLERSVPPEVWALVAASLGAVGGWVGGWVGKTLTAEVPPPPAAVVPFNVEPTKAKPPLVSFGDSTSTKPVGQD